MSTYFEGEWRSRIPNRTHLDEFLSLGSRLCIYDLGASGGTPPPFCWILEGISLVNFEPDKRAQTETEGRNCPVAIGSPTMRTLYLNRRQTTSSLLPPCKAVVDRYDFSKMFPDEPQIFETVQTVAMQAMGLDVAIESHRLPPPDFLKIDVQGVTFEALDSGREVLSASVLGLQVEVEFLEIYAGQKTFGVVHEFLEQQGFEIFRLTNVNRWHYKTSVPLKNSTGQDVFCDLLYLRSLRHVEMHPAFWTEKRINQFLMICLLYDLTDTAAAFLERFIAKGLIAETSVKEVACAIRSWPGAVEFFYHPSQTVRDAPGGRHLLLNSCVTLLKAVLPASVYQRLKRDYNARGYVC